MPRFIDLSHEITDGLTTYPGLAAPQISSAMSFDESHSHYAAGYEFEIGRIEMVANTGTYIDSPAHRIRGGADLADFDLRQIAGLDVVVVATQDTTIGPQHLEDR
ncbi:MAG: cyclase family protein, partial [Acidimicrobiia bacterium]